MDRVRLACLWTVSFLFACGVPPAEPEEPTEEEPEYEPPEVEGPQGASSRRTVYVPAYSHLDREGGDEILFAITLSVRNVDPSATVELTHVEYHDTAGRRVRRYLTEPRALAPLETAEFTVDTFDETGGSGANFLVYWQGPSDAHALLTETVMIGHVGTGYVAFTSRGVELDRPLAIGEATPATVEDGAEDDAADDEPEAAEAEDEPVESDEG
ncbi:MAG: DUF3124 domain-containing protein [Deltaproteobacteria bacterium]|nr:DUF3124 domain-containing protein [Deltaproteobacteria bacterium]